VYVPAGWTWCGGDREAIDGLPRRHLWVDAFIIKRFPVTNRSYLAFLRDLTAQGRVEEATRWAPQARQGLAAQREGSEGARRVGDHTVRWDLDWPVVVNAYSVGAYAEWLAECTGHNWRLPAELEWEKAARGVDERRFPWGDFLDPTWCCMRDSHTDRGRPAPVTAYPIDESPYGVRGLAGNTRDWCLDRYRREGPEVIADRAVLRRAAVDEPRACRGGNWYNVAARCHAASRFMHYPDHNGPGLGVRMARSVHKPGDG